jgi:hypothetical protein
MSIVTKGDTDIKNAPTTLQKALRINLNKYIYGSFAEIGAGQETVRHFFQAGASSGTIAKAMSAYDKDFSDAIYGREESGRYVTDTRLHKMLKHESEHLEKLLSREKHPDKLFFGYANTVTTIDFAKKFKGHGWMGIRFQLDPMESYNEIVLHVRFMDNSSHLQQQVLGKMGVNLIYGAFYYHNNPRELLLSLYDNIEKDQIEIDVINFSGKRFMYVDNRLMSLQLVKNGMTNAVMFDPHGRNLLPGKELYKKNILALRGSFRPVTKVNVDIFERSKQRFLKKEGIENDNSESVFEISLSNLLAEGGINERDFIDRVELISSLGKNVMLTNYQEYFRLAEYFSKYTKEEIVFAMGVHDLEKIFDKQYYEELNGGIMEAFGKLFKRNMTLYIYPSLDDENNKIITSNNLTIIPELKELFNYFKHSGKIIDIEDYDENLLTINAKEVFQQITDNKDGWEEKLPGDIAQKIKNQRLFGFKHRAVE